MDDYFNPALSQSERQALYWENHVALACSRALLGSISPNFQAVSFLATFDSRVEVYFALDADDADDRAEILEEFPFELDVLLDGRVEIISRIWIGPDWPRSDWHGRDNRLVFARRRPTESPGSEA